MSGWATALLLLLLLQRQQLAWQARLQQLSQQLR
jgi:hypothetical protein